MHCGLLEEADMDSTGQSFFFFFFFCEIWLLCGENELLLGELPPICWIGLNFLCSL